MSSELDSMELSRRQQEINRLNGELRVLRNEFLELSGKLSARDREVEVLRSELNNFRNQVDVKEREDAEGVGDGKAIASNKAGIPDWLQVGAAVTDGKITGSVMGYKTEHSQQGKDFIHWVRLFFEGNGVTFMDGDKFIASFHPVLKRATKYTVHVKYADAKLNTEHKCSDFGKACVQFSHYVTVKGAVEVAIERSDGYTLGIWTNENHTGETKYYFQNKEAYEKWKVASEEIQRKYEVVKAARDEIDKLHKLICTKS